MVIEHDEFFTLYGHLKANSFTKKVGDKVKAGEQIAIMGNTGGNYAIHLHVELSATGNFRPDKETNTQDPKPYLKVVGNNTMELKNPEG